MAHASVASLAYPARPFKFATCNSSFPDGLAPAPPLAKGRLVNTGAMRPRPRASEVDDDEPDMEPGNTHVGIHESRLATPISYSSDISRGGRSAPQCSRKAVIILGVEAAFLGVVLTIALSDLGAVADVYSICHECPECAA